MSAAFAYPGRTESDDTSIRQKNQDSVDRRSGDRVPLEAEISLESDSQFFTALSGNLSSGGIFVATYQAVPVGAPVALRVALPDGELVAKGTVRWVRDVSSGASPGLGIAFEGLAADAAARIERFCAARPPLLHDDDEWLTT
jgi:uncharacterized protein (TIGR02266 family)